MQVYRGFILSENSIPPAEPSSFPLTSSTAPPSPSLSSSVLLSCPSGIISTSFKTHSKAKIPSHFSLLDCPPAFLLVLLTSPLTFCSSPLE